MKELLGPNAEKEFAEGKPGLATVSMGLHSPELWRDTSRERSSQLQLQLLDTWIGAALMWAACSPVGAVALHRRHVGQTLPHGLALTGTGAACRHGVFSVSPPNAQRRPVHVTPQCLYLDSYRSLQPRQRMSGCRSCLEAETLQVICFLGPSFGSHHCRKYDMK